MVLGLELADEVVAGVVGVRVVGGAVVVAVVVVVARGRGRRGAADGGVGVALRVLEGHEGALAEFAVDADGVEVALAARGELEGEGEEEAGEERREDPGRVPDEPEAEGGVGRRPAVGPPVVDLEELRGAAGPDEADVLEAHRGDLELPEVRGDVLAPVVRRLVDVRAPGAVVAPQDVLGDGLGDGRVRDRERGADLRGHQPSVGAPPTKVDLRRIEVVSADFWTSVPRRSTSRSADTELTN